MSARVTRPAAGVALLTLARPPVNALDAAGYHLVADHLDTLASSPDVRAVVLTADGDRAFCAGTDTATFADEVAYAEVCAAGRHFFAALAALPVPIVGALNGPAVGAGAMMAAECGVLVATPGAYFSIPELSLGVPGAASHAKRLAPYFKVQRMMLLGERLTVEEAVAAGTVARVVERDDLVPAAVATAEEIAAHNPRAVRAARAIFGASEREAALAGYHAELDAALAIVRAGPGAVREVSEALGPTRGERI